MKLWITRDNIGNLWLHIFELNIIGILENKAIYSLDKDLFPEITIENSPQRVELKK